jgi:mannose-6-phosphate isomerase-like protein (cupin superfamily)
MSRTIEVVRLRDAFDGLPRPWSPRVVGDVSGFQAKAVKLRGEFVWHHHEDEDELFLVLQGVLTMRLRDGDLTVGPGELVVIPRGVEHCPAATDGDVHVLLFEPATTKRMGNLEAPEPPGPAEPGASSKP